MNKLILIREHVGLRLKLLERPRSLHARPKPWLGLHLLLDLVGSDDVILLLLLELLELFEGGNGSKAATNLLFDEALV